MRMKKVLAMALAVAMVLSTMSFSVFATENSSSPALPNAEVLELGAITIDEYSVYDGGLSEGTTPIDLQVAMEFIAKDTPEEAAANYYGNYTTDFFITMNGLSGNSFIADGCYLAGNYGSFGWIQIPIDGLEIEDGVTYPVITTFGFDFKYTDICSDVQDFKCGIYLSDEVLKNNPDLEVTLELGLSEDIDAAQNTDFVQVDSYTYTADELAGYVAKVGDVGYNSVDAALEAAYNAGVKDVVITLVGDTDVNTTDSIDLYLKYDNGTAFNTVTIRQEDASKPYYLFDVYTGWTLGKFVFDGVNLVVTDQFFAINKVELINNSTITRDDDGKNFIFQGDMYIEPGSKFISLVDGLSNGSSLTVDGGRTDGAYNTTAGYKTVYLTVDEGNTMNMINGAYVIASNYETSTATVNGTLNMQASMFEGCETLFVNGVLNIDADSVIKVKNIKGSGNLVIDASKMSAGEVAAFKNVNLSAFGGAVKIANADGLEAKIVDGKIKLVSSYIASIGSTQYSDLQDALDAAQNGDTIEIYEGEIDLGKTTYTIDKEVTIKGAGKGKTILNFEFAGAASAFTVAADNVTISDLTMVQEKVVDSSFFISVARGGQYGAYTVAYSDVKLQNIDFVGGKYALCITAEDILVDSCDFTNQDSSNVIIYAVKGDSKITNNTFTTEDGGKYAIMIEGGTAGETLATSQLISTGNLTIDGNTCTDIKLFFIFNQYGYTKDLTLDINKNVIDGCTNKPIAFNETTSDTGEEFAAINIRYNVFKNTQEGRPVIADERSNENAAKIKMSYNYWGNADAPTIGKKDSADNLLATYKNYSDGVHKYEILNYYTDEALTRLVNLDAVAEVYKRNTVARSTEWVLVDCYATLAEAVKAAESGNLIKLIDDVTLEETLTIPAGKEFILDLNGKTLTAENCDAISTVPSSSLTIQDTNSSSLGKIVGSFDNQGSLVVTGGTFSENVDTYTQDGYKAVYLPTTESYHVVTDFVAEAIADKDTAVAGDTITVEVKVTEGGSYTNASWVLKYDPTYVTYNGTDAKNFKISGSKTDGNTDNGIDEFDETTVLGTYTFTVNEDVRPGDAVFEIVEAEVHNYAMAIEFDGVPASTKNDTVAIQLKAGVGTIAPMEVPYNGMEQRGNLVEGAPANARITYSETNDFTNGTNLPPAFVDAGAHTYYAKIEVDGYDVSVVAGTLTITPIDVNPSVAWSVAPESNRVGYTPVITGVLDETYQGGTVTIKNADGDVLETLPASDFAYDGHGKAVYTGGELTISGVTSGNLTLTIEYIAGADDNYTSCQSTATVNVDKSTIDETTESDLEDAIAGNGEVVYDGETHYVTIDQAQLPNGWTASVSAHPGVTVFGDINVVDVTFTDTTGKYNDYTATVLVKIVRREVTIYVNNASKKNGQADSEATNWGTTASPSIIDNDLGIITVVRAPGETGEVEGTYGITATYTPNNNYIVTIEDGTLTITDAVYVIEVVDNAKNNNAGIDTMADYTVGTRMILVHTNSDYAFFSYNGKKMYDVSDAGYEYVNHDYDNDTHLSEGQYQHVYAIVVPAEYGYEATEANEGLYTRGVAYAGKNPTASYAPVKVTYDADINDKDALHVNDYSSVKGIYNSIYNVDRYQMSILKADYNKNKIVNTADAQAVKDVVVR